MQLILYPYTEKSKLFRRYNLKKLFLNKFNISNCINASFLFKNCKSLKYIKCTKEFKEWCLEHQNKIYLPKSMREGGDGIWDIVD